MELLPIIYTSLLIVVGLFAVTVVISFVTYKVRQKNNEEEALSTETMQSIKPQTSFQEKPVRTVEPEYKPSSNPVRTSSPETHERISDPVHHHSSSKSKYEDQRRDEKYARKEERSVKAPPSIRKPEPEKRIEILTDLKTGRAGKTEQQASYERRDKSSSIKRYTRDNDWQDKKQTEDTDKTTDRKKLKSIDDDPFNKYSDSSNDDGFQPLRTDD